MKRKIFSILFVLTLVLTLCLVPATPAGAATTLIATGTAGTEATIVVPVAAGTTLGDINSIQWQEWLVKGYPPHVDIILDLGEDGTDALVVEYAYNYDTHYGEVPHAGTEAYGAQTGAWYWTFNDDGNGPSAVTDTTFAWLDSGAAGPYPTTTLFPIAYTSVDDKFVGGTLGDWKAGGIVNEITSATTVLRLEIEVDNWIKDTEAKVRNISLNPGSSISMTVDVPDIVAISVDPAMIDFGTLVPGQTSSLHDIGVQNIGTHEVKVDASVGSGDLFTKNLCLKNITDSGDWEKGSPWEPIITSMAMGESKTLRTRLEVPSDHTPSGPESATLIFEASATGPL